MTIRQIFFFFLSILLLGGSENVYAVQRQISHDYSLHKLYDGNDSFPTLAILPFDTSLGTFEDVSINSQGEVDGLETIVGQPDFGCCYDASGNRLIYASVLMRVIKTGDAISLASTGFTYPLIDSPHPAEIYKIFSDSGFVYLNDHNPRDVPLFYAGSPVDVIVSVPWSYHKDLVNADIFRGGGIATFDPTDIVANLTVTYFYDSEAVPELSVWAALTIGFALVGVNLRRKRLMYD